MLVTGPCGGSAAGLRELRAGRAGGGDTPAVAAYRRPVARLREGELARVGGAHAMIDISDGLALDLHRLADASGVGFALDDVPVAPGASVDEALAGARTTSSCSPATSRAATGLCDDFVDAGLRLPVRIGTVVDDPEVRLLDGSALERLGWQHRLG